jgi:hypothetical protein
MHWVKYVYYSFLISALLASLKGFNNKKYVLFIPLLSLSLIVEFLKDWRLINSPFVDQLIELFIAIEYTFLSLIISGLVHSALKRNIIRFSITIVVPALVLVKLSIANEIRALRYLDLLVAAPFICIWTILYLFETAIHDGAMKFHQNPMFWVSLGNLLFFSGSFFSYGFGSYMIAKGQAGVGDAILWIARILNILLYFLYFVGLLCLPKK